MIWKEGDPQPADDPKEEAPGILTFLETAMQVQGSNSEESCKSEKQLYDCVGVYTSVVVSTSKNTRVYGLATGDYVGGP